MCVSINGWHFASVNDVLAADDDDGSGNDNDDGDDDDDSSSNSNKDVISF